MLNRIYIIVGTLAIIVLAGAFIVPRFIQWGDYRVRMEELATGMLGTPVTIRGDIDFSLLPQPRLSFTNVLVGSAEEPAATVDRVDAEFSLIDFLRDNYVLTSFVLDGPVIDFTVDESGLFGSGVTLASDSGGVGLSDTTIRNGTLRLFDRRTGQTLAAEAVDGQLRLSGLGGPLQFQGAASYRNTRYSVRLSSAAPDSVGAVHVSASVGAQGGGFSLAADGTLMAGMAPRYDGTLTYRQSPPAAEAAQDIRGDLVLEAQVTASTDRIVLTGYTLQPDENRAGTRLTGAASIQLGERLGFDAVISGGVFSLPPRDANEAQSQQPYELLRLLEELPAPPTTPIPGRVGLDLSEVGLRAFALRNVRLDATTDGSRWTIDTFRAELPGDTAVSIAGTISAEGGRPAFTGSIDLASQRLDALAALWRPAGEDNSLFGVPGGFSAQVRLGTDALGLSDALLTVDGQEHPVELRIGFGAERRLDLTAELGTLEGSQSVMLAALLPNIGSGPAFAISFPAGSFGLEAEAMQILGQSGRGLVAQGQWSNGSVSLQQLAAEDWGGAGFNLSGSAGGSLAAPVISGSGSLEIAAASAPVLTAAYAALGVPDGWQAALRRSFPARLQLELGAKEQDGSQALTLSGEAGASQATLRLRIDGPLTSVGEQPLRLNAALEAENGSALAEQVGLGPANPFPADQPVLVSASLAGSVADGFEGQVTGSHGEASLSFTGDVSVGSGGVLSGAGTLVAREVDATALAAWSGARGIDLPVVSGSANLEFEGNRSVSLSGIEGQSFSGSLALTRTGEAAVVSGDVQLDAVTPEALAAAMFGRAALVPGAGPWPDGPIFIGDAARTSRGSVDVTAGTLSTPTADWSDIQFDFGWDETRLRLARLSATQGDGSLAGDLTVCCTGALAEKTVNARLTVDGVAVSRVVPAAGFEGSLSGVLQAEGTGASIADVMGSLAGEGSFTVADLVTRQLSPEVFPALAGLQDALTLETDALEAIIGVSLAQGPFTAPGATGAFSIAGGVLRLANFIVEGEGGRLAGGLSVDLERLGLDGSFVLTPRDWTDPSGLVQTDTARIITRIAGTVLAPLVTLDLAEMVAAIQVRANELEVERLEELRLADEERQRAAAQERNRLIKEQKRRAAEIAEQAAADAAANAASTNQPLTTPNVLEEGVRPEATFDFSLPNQLVPPPVNQPAIPGAARP